MISALKKQDGTVTWSADVLADRPADLHGFDSRAILRGGIRTRIQSSASDGETLYQNVFDQSRMIALDCRTGARRWTYRAHAWLYSHPVVADNYVLASSEDLCLHCIDRRSGKAAWKKMTGGIVAAPPAVMSGRVYAAVCNESSCSVSISKPESSSGPIATTHLLTATGFAIAQADRHERRGQRRGIERTGVFARCVDR